MLSIETEGVEMQPLETDVLTETRLEVDDLLVTTEHIKKNWWTDKEAVKKL